MIYKIVTYLSHTVFLVLLTYWVLLSVAGVDILPAVPDDKGATYIGRFMLFVLAASYSSAHFLPEDEE